MTNRAACIAAQKGKANGVAVCRGAAIGEFPDCRALGSAPNQRLQLARRPMRLCIALAWFIIVPYRSSTGLPACR